MHAGNQPARDIHRVEQGLDQLLMAMQGTFKLNGSSPIQLMNHFPPSLEQRLLSIFLLISARPTSSDSQDFMLPICQKAYLCLLAMNSMDANSVWKRIQALARGGQDSGGKKLEGQICPNLLIVLLKSANASEFLWNLRIAQKERDMAVLSECKDKASIMKKDYTVVEAENRPSTKLAVNVAIQASPIPSEDARSADESKLAERKILRGRRRGQGNSSTSSTNSPTARALTDAELAAGHGLDEDKDEAGCAVVAPSAGMQVGVSTASVGSSGIKRGPIPANENSLEHLVDLASCTSPSRAAKVVPSAIKFSKNTQQNRDNSNDRIKPPAPTPAQSASVAFTNTSRHASLAWNKIRLKQDRENAVVKAACEVVGREGRGCVSVGAQQRQLREVEQSYAVLEQKTGDLGAVDYCYPLDNSSEDSVNSSGGDSEDFKATRPWLHPLPTSYSHDEDKDEFIIESIITELNFEEQEVSEETICLVTQIYEGPKKPSGPISPDVLATFTDRIGNIKLIEKEKMEETVQVVEEVSRLAECNSSLLIGMRKQMETLLEVLESKGTIVKNTPHRQRLMQASLQLLTATLTGHYSCTSKLPIFSLTQMHHAAPVQRLLNRCRRILKYHEPSIMDEEMCQMAEVAGIKLAALVRVLGQVIYVECDGQKYDGWMLTIVERLLKLFFRREHLSS